MFKLETWELLSYVVTVVGLPFAIFVFLLDKRKQRLIEEEEIYQRLSDEYTKFMRLVMDNADLRLLSREIPPGLSEEQLERKKGLFNILVALFERSYILVWEERMSPQTRRLWQSWEDYMRDWCRRKDFREALPELLRGEDESFAAHISRIAKQESRNEK